MLSGRIGNREEVLKREEEEKMCLGPAIKKCACVCEHVHISQKKKTKHNGETSSTVYNKLSPRYQERESSEISAVL